jgi:hypothetical protein
MSNSLRFLKLIDTKKRRARAKTPLEDVFPFGNIMQQSPVASLRHQTNNQIEFSVMTFFTIFLSGPLSRTPNGLSKKLRKINFLSFLFGLCLCQLTVDKRMNIRSQTCHLHSRPDDVTKGGERKRRWRDERGYFKRN